MNATRPNNDEQASLWNGVSGHAWVEAQELLDRMFTRFEELLVEIAGAKPRAHVLDVGCGTGATTLALKRRLGSDSECVGVDISAPMLEHARTRAERERLAVSFLRADAENYAFEPGRFDLIVSRFGVMFFDDTARAFANLHRAARDDAELCSIAWRSASENPFMTAAERAAAKLLPDMPPREPDAPGQFRFADSSRVRRMLEESGWADVRIEPLDVECNFATLDLTRYLTRFGALGRFLQQSNREMTERVLDTVRPAFDAYVQGPNVRFVAACWKIEARKRA